MKQVKWAAVAVTILVTTLVASPDVRAQRHTIDSQRSKIAIRVYKSGLFSIFAHDHEIRASIARGEVDDSANPSVEFWIDAGSLRVVDPDLSAKDRAEVQRTMEGTEVLDIGQFQEIHFRSVVVEKEGANRWIVRGELSLHGQNRPVVVAVSETDGNYVGSATLRQRDFGITPITIAGGTVRVKDSVKVEFEVGTMR